MNWKHEAVNKLRRYDAMQRATVNLPLEIKRLKAETEAVRSGLQVGFAGGKSSRSKEDALLDNLMKRQQLQWSLDQAESWTGTVSRALGALEPEEQLILQQLYILPREGAVGQLMERLSVERSTVYRRRDKALKKFTLSLYGGEESN
jgi:DNA-directed RNA polymerase specialized sigma subunit